MRGGTDASETIERGHLGRVAFVQQNDFNEPQFGFGSHKFAHVGKLTVCER